MSIKSTVETKLLRAAIEKTAILPGVSSSPVLNASMVKISAGMDGLVLTRIGSESMISLTVPADVEEEGDTYVGHSNLLNVMGSFSGEFVTLGVKGDKLTLKSDRSNGSVMMVDGDLFPAEPEDEMADVVIKPSIEDFHSWLSVCAPAAAQAGASKAHLEGVALRKMEEDRLCMVGTDTKRLHLILTGIDASPDVLIPNEAVSVLLKITDGVTGQAKILISESSMRFYGPDIDFRCSLSASKMPNITPVTQPEPESVAHRFQINRDSLLSAVRSVSRLGGTVSFTVGKLSTEIEASQSEIELKETVDSKNEGDTFQFRLPGNQAVVAIQKTESDELLVELTSNFFMLREKTRRLFVCLVREQAAK